MPFIPVPNTLAIDVIYELDGQRVENTLYAEAADVPWDEDSILGMLNAIRGIIVTDLLPLLANSIQLVQLIGTLLDAVDSIAVTLNVSPPVAGGVSGGAMPNNVTYTIQFKTLLRGRSFRGRNYVPGLPRSEVTGNAISASLRTGLLDFYSTLQALIEAGGATWVVVSRFSNGLPRVTGVTTPITGPATADTVTDSQRRRLPGRGT